jgi:hypothetical protein
MIVGGHCARVPLPHAFVTNVTPLAANEFDASGYLFHT